MVLFGSSVEKVKFARDNTNWNRSFFRKLRYARKRNQTSHDFLIFAANASLSAPAKFLDIHSEFFEGQNESQSFL